LLYSVCIATYNGANFIEAQLHSIISQIPDNCEIIISDNNSTDDTVKIIKSFSDSRISVIHYNQKSITGNFENALNNCKGDIIYLSDQDDIWLPNKFKLLASALKHHDIVVGDCIITNGSLIETERSFIKKNRSSTGFLANIIKNSYIGCCMAFNRKILNHALPFPKNIPMHDWWIGLVGEVYGKPIILKEATLLYRRHGSNNSMSSEKSTITLSKKIEYRFILLKSLLERIMF